MLPKNNKYQHLGNYILEDYHIQLENVAKSQQKILSTLNNITSHHSNEYVLSQLIMCAETLQEIAERRMTTITFAKHNIYHYSILKYHILEDAISQINIEIVPTSNIEVLQKFIAIDYH